MSCCTDWPREKDPELHDFYARNLLEPGWGGEVNDVELAYIQRKLLEDSELAYLWGFAPGAKTRPADAVRRVAMHGDPERRMGNYLLARPRKAVKHAQGEAMEAVGRLNSDGRGQSKGFPRGTPVGD